MFRVIRRLIVAVLALIGLVAVAGAAMLASGGISARPEPGRLEMAVAPRLRSLAIPAAARNQTNPVPASPQAIADGRLTRLLEPWCEPFPGYHLYYPSRQGTQAFELFKQALRGAPA